MPGEGGGSLLYFLRGWHYISHFYINNINNPAIYRKRFRMSQNATLQTCQLDKASIEGYK